MEVKLETVAEALEMVVVGGKGRKLALGQVE